jgi:RND superfamily putative drug exporter
VTATLAPPSGALQRLAGWSFRHRRRALLLWVAVLAAATAASSAIGSDYHNDHSLPGTESQAAVDALGARGGDTIQVVFQDPAGLDAAGAEAVLRDVRGLSHVAGVSGLEATSRDGTIGYATVALDGRAEQVPHEAVRRIIDVAQSGDLRVELGGDAVRAAEEPEGGAAEGVGMLAALVILVLLFGSLLAATLPLVTAILAVGTTLGLIVLASHATDIADYTPPLMMLVGLGVGIDYALLIFSRFRGELLAGAPREQAVRTALDTAGRSVFFAALTVIVALLGLLVLGLAALRGMALAVALTVLVTMLASLTLLPALLGALGGRIERTVRRRGADGERWRRWAGFVQRRPWPPLVAAVALLLVIAAPALDMRLGFADAGTDDPSTTSRQAYDLLAEGFGPGFSGPLLIVGEGDASGVVRMVESTRGVASATAGGPGTVVAFPETSPQDPQTAALVERLREALPPGHLVGGPTAAATDFSDAVADRLPLFVAVVVGLSALLLGWGFRSVLIPIKAALLNLLSIGAALGVIALVFQEGLLGAQPGPVEAFVPVLIFAIVFGLSMDYEVFLVSRMREEWERTGDARGAVNHGLATTGRVVTAAGLIMVVVFGAFVLAPSRMLQQFGLGLAVAILVDAFVIRCLIVPAVMGLLGERAWRLRARRA